MPSLSLQKDTILSRTFLRLYMLRYFLAALFGLELLILFVNNSVLLQNFRKNYNHNMSQLSDYAVHRILNPLFVFDSPREWQGPVLPVEDMFPEHKILQDNWKIIRDEALSVCDKSSGLLQSVAKASPAAFASLSRYSNQINNKTNVDFWKTSILMFYGREFPEVQSKCPRTMEILRKLPNVDVAMFSVMESGATIPVHRGPLRGALRYHLPLVVPGYDVDGNELPGKINEQGTSIVSTDSSKRYDEDLPTNTTADIQNNRCHIVVGEDIRQHYGRKRGANITPMIPGSNHAKTYPTYSHAWKPGQGVLFDDTYAHSVANHHTSESRRIVLFMDVRRPSAWKKNHYFNFGPMLFTLIRWTGLPAVLFFKNAKNEKPVFRHDVKTVKDLQNRRLQNENQRIEISYNHLQ